MCHRGKLSYADLRPHPTRTGMVLALPFVTKASVVHTSILYLGAACATHIFVVEG